MPSSSSASIASLISLGVRRFLPVFEHTMPDKSSISAQIYSNAAAMKIGAPAPVLGEYVLDLRNLPILPTGKVIPARYDLLLWNLPEVVANDLNIVAYSKFKYH